MLLLGWCPCKIQDEKRVDLHFTRTDRMSLVLTSLRIRWTIPLNDNTKNKNKNCNHNANTETTTKNNNVKILAIKAPQHLHLLKDVLRCHHLCHLALILLLLSEYKRLARHQKSSNSCSRFISLSFGYGLHHIVPMLALGTSNEEVY
jgi:hypothetical protein